MLPIKTICLVIALVLFLLASANVTAPRLNLLALGLVFLTLALLLPV